jgi:hypothetical protein
MSLSIHFVVEGIPSVVTRVITCPVRTKGDANSSDHIDVLALHLQQRY